MFITWLATLWTQPWVPTLLWALLAGAIGLLWGLGELVGAFKNETGRSLRTSGAWLLLLLNFAAAAVAYGLVVAVASGANSWLTAVAVGVAWPTVIRNTTLKLVQPLQPDASGETLALHFEQAYAAVQALARQLINAALARQRMQLVTRAIELDLAALERHVRLTLIASPLPITGDESTDNYVDKIMEREVDDDIKKAHLAMVLVQLFDRATLEDALKTLQRKPRNKKGASA
ncbi:MAG: hypothetical protein IAE85_17215 [Anaerolinea sp.]|nr:hypothetical protein [Anaerolinea sp.]HRI57330.1 hypothetical protein [Anaerolineae bacterium]